MQQRPRRKWPVWADNVNFKEDNMEETVESVVNRLLGEVPAMSGLELMEVATMFMVQTCLNVGQAAGVSPGVLITEAMNVASDMMKDKK